MSAVIPFGKYRGQPVDALLADKSYLDWLLAQACGCTPAWGLSSPCSPAISIQYLYKSIP